MCSFIKQNICTINNSVCPWVYFCNRLGIWKPSTYMPSDCKVKQSLIIPKGYYKVCFEKRNRLYVSINNQIEIFQNPYNFVPQYVKVITKKNGSKIIKDWK